MSKSNFHFWQRWLTYANIMTIIVGLLCAFAGNSFVFDLHNSRTAALFFDSSIIPSDLLPFKNWLFGVIGGTIVGFHVLMVMISEYAIKKKEKWAYRAMWYGLISWFVIDSGVSLYYGAIHNIIIINLTALILIGLPLIMIRKEFR